LQALIQINGYPRPGPRLQTAHFRRRKELSMLDLIMLAIVLGFFALSIGYTIACDRL
jgi:hypothetical protein